MKFNILVFIILLFTACNTSKPITELTQDDILITLTKDGCFGECPIYTFNIYAGGYSEFIGKRNTSKLGTHAKQLDKEVYKSTLSSFKESKFHDFDNNYESSIEDLPLITMSYNNGRSLKTVKGKREMPTLVHRLQFKLEQIAENDSGWILIDENVEEVDEGPAYIKTQIILVLKHGNQLSKWFNQMRQEHGLRILKRLNNTNDSWLVSYDTRKYKPEEMLELLRNDENVKSADFNIESDEKG